MRKLLVRVVLLGAAVGAGLAIRNHVRASSGAQPGAVQIVLRDGATTVEPGSAEAEEFTSIARNVVEVAS